MSKKTFSIVLSDKDRETIARLKELSGIQSTSDLFRMSLREWYSTLEPAYLQRRLKAQSRPRYDNPEERVKAQIERKKKDSEAKRAIEKERQLNICTRLDGKIIEQAGGHLACEFKLYEKVGSRILEGSRVVPFENLHESMIESQYKGGTIEEIKALLENK